MVFRFFKAKHHVICW